MTTLLLEPFGGLAGDMLLAALCDLEHARFGVADLVALAQELVPGEAELELTRTTRGGIAAAHLAVRTPESVDPPHRHLHELLALLEGSSLAAVARARATAALTALAAAEAEVHGTSIERVHLHEVAAVDTLIDVGGAALALERLGVTRVLATPPLVGEGTLRCAHGILPVPAPAVAGLLRGRRQVLGGGCERTTPTGAAILAAWSEEVAPGCSFVGLAQGYGAGTRDPAEGPPNLVRVRLGREEAPGARVEAWLMEVNLDDMPPEEVGHAVGALRAAGALEVWTSPVWMKKERPGAVVSALCRDGVRDSLEESVFRWTTSLGVRWTRLERRECGRREREVEVGGHPVRVKVRERPGVAAPQERDLAPEHDDVARTAEATGLSLREVRRRAIEAALRE